ncbi:hypothetical protein LCGC14_1816710 [marine sediment metagenome]|uniref:Phage head morphogenesis domain-containing protein n=1 Tax=marine sediment metagenome TaxID=412755 RepID=A0A0F9GK59_9ZZZZ
MPVEPCRSKGRPGFRAGPNQRCYTYVAGNAASRNEAKRKAHVQLAAIGGKAFKALTDLLNDPQFWAQQRTLMMDAVMPIFREAFMVGAMLGAEQKPVAERVKQAPVGGAGDPLLVLPFDFEAVVASGDVVIAEFTNEWWAQFEQATQNGLRSAIQRAADSGLGVESVIKDIEPLFGEARATRIAVTETTRLMGQGAQETYRQAGFTKWEWRTVRDAVVDPICQALDKKQFPMSRKFEPAHPQCRCWSVPAGKPEAQPVPAVAGGFFG